jgi:hypothetical protein
MLPLPSNIKSWNGKSAPAWDQPHERRHQSRTLLPLHGHLKNKDLTGAPRHLYGGLFDLTGISGNPTIGARSWAGWSTAISTVAITAIAVCRSITSWKATRAMSAFRVHENTNYRHAGTSVLTGRERNIDAALGLV